MDLKDYIRLDIYSNMLNDIDKIFKPVQTERPCSEVQDDICKLFRWSEVWKMKFSADKCWVIQFGEAE